MCSTKTQFNLQCKHAKSFADTGKSFSSIWGHLDRRTTVLNYSWTFSALSGQSYLSSARLVLDVVNGADLGAYVLQVRSRGVDGTGASWCTGHWWLLFQRGLLGNRWFGDDSAAVCGFTISGGSWSCRCGGGDGSTGCRELRTELLRT